MSTDERAAFEAWRKVRLRRIYSDYYESGVTQYMWRAWQARSALASPEPPAAAVPAGEPAFPTFANWWRSKHPATIDQQGFALLEEAFNAARFALSPPPESAEALVAEPKHASVDQASAPVTLPEAAGQSSPWVSVQERRPPAAQEVIVYGMRPGREWHGTGKRVHVQFINTRPWECIEDYEITHWMPLPAAPKEQP